jgi:hypothetical protein
MHKRRGPSTHLFQRHPASDATILKLHQTIQSVLGLRKLPVRISAPCVLASSERRSTSHEACLSITECSSRAKVSHLVILGSPYSDMPQLVATHECVRSGKRKRSHYGDFAIMTRQSRYNTPAIFVLGISLLGLWSGRISAYGSAPKREKFVRGRSDKSRLRNCCGVRVTVG